jgi:hypothetical protein
MLCRKRSTLTLMVIITSTNFAVLRWVQELSGIGFVYEGRVGKWGRLPIGYYRCQGDGAYSLLRQLQPYIRIKTKQLAFGLETQERLRTPSWKADRTWQEPARIQMSQLNGRRLG